MSLRRLANCLRGELAQFDPAQFSVAECAVLAAELARVAKACETAATRATARAACDRKPEWFARLSGSNPGAARAALTTLEEVEKCPDTKEALLTGDISLEQAAAVASASEHEPELLDLALRSGLGPVKDAARKHRLASMNPEELHRSQLAAREYREWVDKMGMLRFRGALPPVAGARWSSRINAQTDREWRTARRESRVEAREALAADAFVALMSESGAAPVKGQVDFVVVADINALRRGHAETGEPCHIIGGGPIPVSVALELANDAFLKAVIHDGVRVHTVKHFGRRRRAEIDTALLLGPAPTFEGVTCSRQGCERRFHLQWDHIKPVADGGETSIENLQPLCLPEHIEKTERDRKAGLLRGKQECGP